MAQVRQVVSEALQATVRRLLPSQQGFTEDLQASNVIQPIIDLTPTAEGSSVPEILQTASSIGNGFVNHRAATTVTVINNTGFWKLDIFATGDASSGGAAIAEITDGTTTSQIFHLQRASGTSQSNYMVEQLSTVIFLGPGESLQAQNTTTSQDIFISYRQIADVNGNFVNPNGFTPS